MATGRRIAPPNPVMQRVRELQAQEAKEARKWTDSEVVAVINEATAKIQKRAKAERARKAASTKKR